MSVEQTPNQIPSLLNLFVRFIRLGLTAFGGPSMVAYIRKLAVEQQRWLDDESFRDGVVLCQMIPGATAMQAAAYVGLRVRGARGAVASFVGFGLPAFGLMMVLSALFVGYQLYGLVGGLIATVGVFLPSFLMVIGTAPYFDRLRRSRSFNQAIGGVLCSFVGLLLTVTVRFAGAISWDALRLLLAGAAFVALLRKVDILWVVLIGAIISVVVF